GARRLPSAAARILGGSAGVRACPAPPPPVHPWRQLLCEEPAEGNVGGSAARQIARLTTKATLRWPSRSQSAGLEGSCKSYALVGLNIGGLASSRTKTPGVERTTRSWHKQQAPGKRTHKDLQESKPTVVLGPRGERLAGEAVGGRPTPQAI